MRQKILIAAIAALTLLSPTGAVWAQGKTVGEAQAQSVPQKEPHRAATEAALAQVRRITTELAQAQKQLDVLSRDYESKLAAIDGLKRKRASWRRDRTLRSKLAESHDLAKQLVVRERTTRGLRKRLLQSQRQLHKAVAAELPASREPTRRRWLVQQERALVQILRRSKKIVVPDVTIDMLADPEELDDQIALIKQSEQQLEAQVAALSQRARRYERMDKLRGKRARAAELSGFDDSQPRRTAKTRAGGDNFENDTPTDGAADPSAPTPPSAGDDSGEPIGESGGGNDSGGGYRDSGAWDDSDPVIVLADVVDASTIEALRRAGYSQDPVVKARAAMRAREQVMTQLKQLRGRRQLIERRASELRKGSAPK